MGLAACRWAHCSLLAEEPLPAAHRSVARTEPLPVAVPPLAAALLGARWMCSSVLVGCAAHAMEIHCSTRMEVVGGLLASRPAAHTGVPAAVCHPQLCCCLLLGSLMSFFPLKLDDDAWKRSTHASCPPLYIY
ncbi:hypothetical protein Dimus_022343 [Dionaea muscipula]